MALGSSPFQPEVVVPVRGTTADRQTTQRLRLIAGVAAGCLLAATVAFASGRSDDQSVLGTQASALGINVPQRYARLAEDQDDRNGLQALFKFGEKKEKEAEQQRKFHSMKALEAAKKEIEETKKEKMAEHTAKVLTSMDHQHEERTAVMVPWVHWPQSGARYESAQKQQLLQEPVELVQDEAAKVMPMSEIMNRIVVDHKLHEGHVSDTQLALADEHQPRAEPRMPAKGLDCAPFC